MKRGNSKKKRFRERSNRKKSLAHHTLVFSGASLTLIFLTDLIIKINKSRLPFSDEIILTFLTLFGVSFFIEWSLRIRKSTIYEVFYSSYISFVLIILSTIFWVSYLNNINFGIFRAFIILAHIIVFLYSLTTHSHSNKLWFILLSYLFTVIISIIAFAYLYWTASIFGISHLQFSDCSSEITALKSENWFYFSSVTFYSLGYGDICPLGLAGRTLSQIEVALGTLINTILIGFIFWKIKTHSGKIRNIRNR